MALGIVSWDLPPAEQLEKYSEKSRNHWIPTLLKQPGVKEYRVYRNPFHTTPQVTGHLEFDKMESWLKFIESKDYAEIISGLRSMGCTNLSAEVWDASPIIPEPLKPPGV